MKAFEIKINGKILDYRVSQNLDLNDIRSFFKKIYTVKNIWQEQRHVLGVLEKEGVEFFLKLATTEGVGAVTQSEFNWNKQFNNLVSRNTSFWVPKNIDSGFYKDNLFYMVVEYFKGDLFVKRPTPDRIGEILKDDLSQIIELSEFIQTLGIEKVSEEDSEDYYNSFFEKTKSWFEAVPSDINNKFGVNKLLEFVKEKHTQLDRKSRHGDFTPWHMMKLSDKKIGLIDGERALKNGVEYYDIGYLIQRIYSVMESPDIAKEILEILLKRNYNLEKLKTILASRAIGGFCDETMINSEKNYSRANKFGQWVLSL